MRRIAAEFLDTQGERIIEALGKKLEQPVSTALLSIHRALFDLVRASVREPSRRGLGEQVHTALTGDFSRPDIRSVLPGQIALWTVLHRMLREADGPHRAMDINLEILALTGDTADGVIGALIDIEASGVPTGPPAGWRTLVELGKTHREFQALGGVVQNLINTRDPAQMFEALEQSILDTFSFRSLVIAAVHHEEGFVEVVRAYPSPGPVGWRYDLSHPDILCHVARTGRMEVVDGWDPRYHERVFLADGSAVLRQCPRNHNVGQTAFFLPILAGGRTVGVVGTGSAQASGQVVLRETERMRPFLLQVGETLSNVTEIAKQKRAEERAEQTIERLNTLVDVSRVVTSTLDLGALLDQIIHRLVRAFPAADKGVIYLYDPGIGRLIPKAWVGTYDERIRHIRLWPGEGVSGKVFRAGLATLTCTRDQTDALRGTLLPENERIFSLIHKGVGIQSNICVPLRTSNGEIIGTITLSSTHTAFSKEDLVLLEGVAAGAAMAIQNARLFEELRVGREQLGLLSHQLLEVQETERRRIARELHDQIGQALIAVEMNLQLLRRLPAASAFTQGLEESINAIEDVLQMVRDISIDLRPSLLDDLGLAAALRWYLDRQAQRAGFSVQLSIDLKVARLPPDVEVTCFRVAQEALTNVARHAQTHCVRVELRQLGGELRLLIRDNGVGFDVDAALKEASEGTSLGLLGMRERALLIGGRIDIDSAPGQGTEIRACFPVASSPSPPDRGERRGSH